MKIQQIKRKNRDGSYSQRWVVDWDFTNDHGQRVKCRRSAPTLCDARKIVANFKEGKSRV
jgi:D-arabinose 1-dehydrogenase-like Zn-dependent alcohol dehydrogenase